MTVRGLKAALWRTGEDIGRKHTLQMAAALSYYFVMSLFPALILFTAILAYVPIHDVLNQTFALIGGFIPQDTISVVERVLSSVISPYRSTFLSFGILGT